MTDNGRKKKTGKVSGQMLWLLLGALGVIATGIPYLILGEESIFVYHDQLDGEVIAYLLQARHLWDGSSVLPEFMNGAAKTALTMPAPACVILYRLLPAQAALSLMQVLGSTAGYVGMFLLLWWAAERSEVLRHRGGAAGFLAMLVAGMYAYLPFLPVYGLSQYGLPLLLYCVLRLGEDGRAKKSYGLAYFYVLLFGVNSSLVLAGFAVLGIWTVWEVAALFRKRFCVRQGIAWGLLLAVYLAENGTLLLELLGKGDGTISHKSEYVLNPAGFLNQFWTNLIQGGQHSVDYHQWIPVCLLLAAVAVWLCRRGRKGIDQENEITEQTVQNTDNRCGKALVASCGGILIFAVAAALWDSAAGVGIRSGMGALKGFQGNRVLWLSPCLWYFALGCSLLLLLECFPKKQAADTTDRESNGAGEKDGRGRKVLGAGMMLVALVTVSLTAVQVLMESNLKPNVQKLLNRDYAAMSFRDYYAIDVLDQVQQYIRETYGEEPEEYRVVSLGIDPAAALYHGFYCLDGYSNNYDLDYKHRFRKIIAPELVKSKYLADNFDHWGNRCYLFSAECPGYYTIQKGGFYFQDYEINAESLAELGGKYLLSAAYIDHSEDTGLELLRQEAFETEESYYRIYLYGVKGK